MERSILKTSLIFFISFAFISNIIAQKSLKIYSNFIYSNVREYPYYLNDTINNAFRFNHLSLGYQYHKNFEPRELEVHVFFKNQQFDDGDIRQFDAHLRYEFDAYFLNELDFLDGLVYSLTPSFRLFYLNELVDAPSQKEFLTKNIKGGIGYTLSGDVVYNLNERLYLNLTVSLVGATFSLEHSFVDNPILTENQKKQTPFNIEFLAEKLLRIGVGYNFSQKEKSN